MGEVRKEEFLESIYISYALILSQVNQFLILLPLYPDTA